MARWPASRALLVLALVPFGAACGKSAGNGGGLDQGDSGNSTPMFSGSSSGSDGTGDPSGASFFSGDAGPIGTLQGCAKASANASLLPTNLLFVVDRSGSMNCNLPPTTASTDCEKSPTKAQAGMPSKWEVVRDALTAALKTLPSSTGVGITYFSNDNTCGVQSLPNVDIRPLTDAQIMALDDSLTSVMPMGGTPLVGATINAYKRLNPNQYKAQPYGNKYVVLLTDGQEDCSPNSVSDLIMNEAPKAVRAYIKTFVIGVPGSEVDRSVLSQLAFAGGTPQSPMCDHSGSSPSMGNCHFDMTQSTDLAKDLGTALAALSSQALTCEFTLPQKDQSGQPIDLASVNVQYTPGGGGAPVQILQDTKPCNGGADGWQYEDGNAKIVICGNSCNTVRGAAKIDIVLGCMTMVK